MKLSSVLYLLAALCLSNPVAAQQGENSVECRRGVLEACWLVKFGTCAHVNPRVAIPACTRRLAGDLRFIRTDGIIGGSRRVDQAQFYALRGNAHFKQGNIDRALSDYNLAIKSSRNVYWVHINRGSAYFEVGEYQAALESFDEALNLSPGNAMILNGRARLLACAPDANVRDGARAVNDSLRAIGVAERVPIVFFDTLAAAHAENGEFELASEIQQNAIELLPPDNQEMIESYRHRLALYQQGMAYRIVPTPGT